MIRKYVPLLVSMMVVFVAIVSGTPAMVESNPACARTSVDVTFGDDASSVDIVVLVNGSSDVSISQQIGQSNGRSQVDIDVEYGDERLTISGETAENGTLVLNVTRDDTVVNESVVVNESDDRALVFHIDESGDVRISQEENSSGCSCDTAAVEPDMNDDVDNHDAIHESGRG